MERKRKCNAPCCGVRTKHKLTFADGGLQRVWECGNCGKQTPVKILTRGDVEELSREQFGYPARRR